MHLWWLFYILGIITGAIIFRKKIRHAIIISFLWVLSKMELILNKGDDDEFRR
jgi:hypothetical protein